MATKAKPEDQAIYNPTTDLEAWADTDTQGGEGLEDSQDIQVQPFLQIVQGMSEILKPNSDLFDENARQGMMYNNATRELYPEHVEFLVAHLYSCYTLWGPDGTSFKGLYAKDAPEVKHCKRSGLEMIHEETGGQFGLTYRMDGLLLHPKETWDEREPVEPITVSLNSKGLKGGKRWVTRMRMLKFRGKDGVMRRLPVYGSTWDLSTFEDKNDAGTFYLFRVQPKRVLRPNDENDAQLIKLAKDSAEFYAALKEDNLTQAHKDDVPF